MLIEISEQLSKVIADSWFVVESGTYVYTSVQQVQHAQEHLLISRDEDEITVVTKLENLPLLGEYQRNPEDWKLLNIKCGHPFYCVGFLASIASEFARNNIDITMTSTYTRDYIMVQAENLDASVQLLRSIGFEQRPA